MEHIPPFWFSSSRVLLMFSPPPLPFLSLRSTELIFLIIFLSSNLPDKAKSFSSRFSFSFSFHLSLTAESSMRFIFTSFWLRAGRVGPGFPKRGRLEPWTEEGRKKRAFLLLRYIKWDERDEKKKRIDKKKKEVGTFFILTFSHVVFFYFFGFAFGRFGF